MNTSLALANSRCNQDRVIVTKNEAKPNAVLIQTPNGTVCALMFVREISVRTLFFGADNALNGRFVAVKPKSRILPGIVYTFRDATGRKVKGKLAPHIVAEQGLAVEIVQ